MTLQEAQQALEQHLPCVFYSKKDSGWLDAKTFYDVEVIQVDTDSTHPRIVTRISDHPGFEIHIASEDFGMLQLTSSDRECHD